MAPIASCVAGVPQIEALYRKTTTLRLDQQPTNGKRAASVVETDSTRLAEAHVMAAKRFHGDDTFVPVLAKGRTDKGGRWISVRGDAFFGYS